MRAAAKFGGGWDVRDRSPTPSLAALALLLIGGDNLGTIASRMDCKAEVALMSPVRILRAQTSLRSIAVPIVVKVTKFDALSIVGVSTS